MKTEDFDPDDYDLPADPPEAITLDDANVIRRVRANISERGGRMIPGAHEGRITKFKVRKNSRITKPVEDLAGCGHEAMAAVAPNVGGRMAEVCVVCDAVNLWPRFEDVA